MVVVAGLLFLAFLTTLRPRLIAAVQGRGDRYRANEVRIGALRSLLTSRDLTQNARVDWAAEISTQLAKPSDRSTAAQIFLPTLVTSSAAVAAYGLPFRQVGI